MKHLFIILFVVTQITGYGQAKISMSPIFSLTPIGANTPVSTANYSTTVTFSGHIKNTGNATFTGTIAVQAIRDTTRYRKFWKKWAMTRPL